MKLTNEIRIALLTSLIAFTSCSSDSEDQSSLAKKISSDKNSTAKKKKAVNKVQANEEVKDQAQVVTDVIEDAISERDTQESDESEEIRDQIEDQVQSDLDNSGVVVVGDQNQQDNEDDEQQGDSTDQAQNQDQSQDQDQNQGQVDPDNQNNQGNQDSQDQTDSTDNSEQGMELDIQIDNSKLEAEVEEKTQEMIDQEAQRIAEESQRLAMEKFEQNQKKEKELQLTEQGKEVIREIVARYISVETPQSKEELIEKSVLAKEIAKLIEADQDLFDQVTASVHEFSKDVLEYDMRVMTMTEKAQEIVNREYCENILAKDKEVEELVTLMNLSDEEAYYAMVDLNLLDSTASKMLLLKMASYNMFHKVELKKSNEIFAGISDSDLLEVESKINSLFTSKSRNFMHDIFSNRENLLSDHIVKSLRTVNMSKGEGIDKDLTTYFKDSVLLDDLNYVIERSLEGSASEIEKSNALYILSNIAGDSIVSESALEFLMTKASDLGAQDSLFSEDHFQTIKALSKFEEGHKVLNTVTGSDKISNDVEYGAAYELISFSEMSEEIANNLNQSFSEHGSTLEFTMMKVARDVLGLNEINFDNKSFESLKSNSVETSFKTRLSGVDASNLFDKLTNLNSKYIAK